MTEPKAAEMPEVAPTDGDEVVSTGRPSVRGRIDVGTVAASALALGALALPDPARLGAGRRHLLRLGRAAYLGWYAHDLIRRTPLPEVQAPLFGAATGVTAALVTAPVDEAVDTWADTRLRSWGVRRPRLLLAAAGAVMGAALAVDNQIRPVTDEDEGLLEPADLFETVEVPAAARALLVAMLDAAGSTAPAAEQGVVSAGLAASARILRGQLDHAQASVLEDGGLSTDVYLSVPADAPRVVPHAQGWPVRAHFETGGLPLQVELWIADGHLSGLSVMLRDDDLAEEDERWATDILDVLEAWPTPEQVRLVIETAEGPRPVG